MVGPGFNGVPARETGADVDVAGLTKVRWIEDLVRRGVCENSFRVDSRLVLVTYNRAEYFVSKGTVASDVIVERNRDVYGFSDNVFEITEFLEVVFAFDVFFVCGIHTCQESADGSNAVSFSDSENGSVDMSCTGLESAVGISNCTARVIVEMALDIAGYYASKGSYQVIHLPWICATNLSLANPTFQTILPYQQFQLDSHPLYRRYDKSREDQPGLI